MKPSYLLHASSTLEEHRLQPGARRRHAATKSLMTLAKCTVWKILPASVQQLAVRLTVHRLTVGACAVVQNDAGRVLLVHHTYRRQPWGLPGGFLRGNESPEDGLSRELREELGAHSRIGPLIHAEISTKSHNLTLYYRVEITSPLSCDGIEIDGCRFVPSDALEDLTGPARWHLIVPVSTVDRRGGAAAA